MKNFANVFILTHFNSKKWLSGCCFIDKDKQFFMLFGYTLKGTAFSKAERIEKKIIEKYHFYWLFV